LSNRFAVRERGPNKIPSLRDFWEAVMQKLAGVAEVDIVDLVEGCTPAETAGTPGWAVPRGRPSWRTLQPTGDLGSSRRSRQDQP
jgi:hypothetical protein